jgi:hypothetical protein
MDGKLYALGSDGSELWEFETDGFGSAAGSIIASPAIGADGTIYIGGLYGSNLYALNPADGSTRWSCNFESNGWPYASPVIATDGTIYQILLYDTKLYAIEPNDGTIKWSTDLADPDSGWFDCEDDNDCEPQPSPGCHYADTYLPYVDGFSEPVLGPDGTIYVSFDDDPYLRAVDPNGSIKWVTKLGLTTGFTLTADSEGRIYAAGDTEDEPGIYVVDPNGSIISHLQSDTPVSFPVVAGTETLLFNDANNTAWAVSPNGCEPNELILRLPEDSNSSETANSVDLTASVKKQPAKK